MARFYFFFLTAAFMQTLSAQFYQTTSANIDFFSSAPVEDIAAASQNGISVLNIENGAISFKVKIRSFVFNKALMQEHFNENYMESEKFPDATFKGNIVGDIDQNSNQPQNKVIKGTLTVHGISKEREIPAIIKFSESGKALSLNSEFNVKCKDHDIKIPKLLWQNIAEVLKVTVDAQYQIISE